MEIQILVDEKRLIEYFAGLRIGLKNKKKWETRKRLKDCEVFHLPIVLSKKYEA